MLVGKLLEGKEKNVLVVCDKNLLGKLFEEGKLQLNVDKDFYGEKEVDRKKIEELLPFADILNLCGEKTLKLFEEMGFKFENILKIKETPHIQVLLI